MLKHMTFPKPNVHREWSTIQNACQQPLSQTELYTHVRQASEVRYSSRCTSGCRRIPSALRYPLCSTRAVIRCNDPESLSCWCSSLLWFLRYSCGYVAVRNGLGHYSLGKKNSQRCVCYFFEVSIVLLRVRIGRLNVKAGKCTTE